MDNHLEKEMLGFLDNQIAAKEKELEALKKVNSNLTEDQYEALPEYLKLIKELNELYRLQRVKKIENTSSAMGGISETPSIDYDFSDDLNWLNKEIQSAENFCEQLDRTKIKSLEILEQNLSEGRSFFESLVKEEQNNLNSDFSDLSGKFDEFKNDYCEYIYGVQEGLKDYQETLKSCKEAIKLKSNKDFLKSNKDFFKSSNKLLLTSELEEDIYCFEKKQMELRRLRFDYWENIISLYASSLECYKYKFIFNKSGRVHSLKWDMEHITKELDEKSKEWGEEYFDWQEKFNSLSDFFSQRKDSLESIHEITKKCDERLKEYNNRLDEIIKELSEISKIYSFSDTFKIIFKRKKAAYKVVVKDDDEPNSFGYGLQLIICCITALITTMLAVLSGLFGLSLCGGIVYGIFYLIGKEQLAENIYHGLGWFIIGAGELCVIIIPPISLLYWTFGFLMDIVKAKNWASLIGYCAGGSIFYPIAGWLYYEVITGTIMFERIKQLF